jgi:hypothetical protein
MRSRCPFSGLILNLEVFCCAHTQARLDAAIAQAQRRAGELRALLDSATQSIARSERFAQLRETIR